MTKSITLEFPEWANWIAQDSDGGIEVYEKEPALTPHTFFARQLVSESKTIIFGRQGNENWRDSKINLNTHGAYIDADGILHRCELVPGMGEWKPLETAPKDGTRVELMNVNSRLTDTGYWCDYSHIHGVPSGEWCQDLGNGDMTHWREPTLNIFKQRRIETMHTISELMPDNMRHA